MADTFKLSPCCNAPLMYLMNKDAAICPKCKREFTAFEQVRNDRG